MIQKQFIGWISVVLFVIAILILAIAVFLVTLPSLAIIGPLNPQAVIGNSGVVALAASVFGFSALMTSPGRVGALVGTSLDYSSG